VQSGRFGCIRASSEPPVDSLAVTDGILCGAAVAIAANRAITPLFRLAATSFALASAFGVLRFSGVYPELFPHTTFSMLTAVMGFPALALAIALPASALNRSWRSAAAVAIGLALAGTVLVETFGFRIYRDGCAVLGTLVVLAVMLRGRALPGMIGSMTMLTGLACFALKIPATPLIQPADVLHLALAAGLTLIAHATTQRGATDIIQVG